MSKKGKIIVIEGTDASGKATQANMLYTKMWADKFPCEIISFPRYGTPTGDIIGECYLGKNMRYNTGTWFREGPTKVNPLIASLYYAADRLNAVPEMMSKTASGTNLILDRYYQSNMGHQGGKIKDKKKRNEMFEFIEKLELELLKIPKEDITIFLYMPYLVANKLKRKMGERLDGHESDLEHLKNAEESYLQLAEKYNWIKINCATDGKSNSLKTPLEISDEVYENVRKIL